MNWSAFATPAEGLAGHAAKILQKQYGKIPGVTDRGYLTNSTHKQRMWLNIEICYDK